MKIHLLIGVIGMAAFVLLLACGILLHERFLVRSSFEYRVCNLQEGRVTFVDGAWQGRTPINPATPQASLNSCPEVWEYLATAGAEGWELVAVVPLTNLPDQHAEKIYLKRTIR